MGVEESHRRPVREITRKTPVPKKGGTEPPGVKSPRAGTGYLAPTDPPLGSGSDAFIW